MFDDRIGNLQKMLARMGPEGRQRYAADHADDPIAVSMALFVNNIAKELKEGKRGEPEMQAPVVQQAIQAMNQPRMPQGMPPQGMPPQGQPQAPQQAPQAMPPQAPQQQAPQGETRMAADGGYMDSRLPEEMGIGALPERSLSNMADGGIVGYADTGLVQPGKTPAQRMLQGMGQSINAANEAAELKNALAKKYGTASALPGMFQEQTDAERENAKAIMGRLNSMSPTEMRFVLETGALPQGNSSGGAEDPNGAGPPRPAPPVAGGGAEDPNGAGAPRLAARPAAARPAAARPAAARPAAARPAAARPTAGAPAGAPPAASSAVGPTNVLAGAGLASLASQYDNINTAGMSPAQILASRAEFEIGIKAIDPVAKERAALNTKSKRFSQEALDEFEKETKDRPDPYAKREERANKQEASIAESAERNPYLSLMEAGFAMMSGTSQYAFENIGKGALVGTKAYKDGIDKIEKAKEKLGETRDKIEDYRINRDDLTAKERRAFKTDIRNTELEGDKNLIAGLALAFNRKDAEVAAAMKAFQDSQNNAVTRRAQVDTAKINELGAGQRTVYSTDAQERMSNADRSARVGEAAANRALQLEIAKLPGGPERLYSILGDGDVKKGFTYWSEKNAESKGDEAIALALAKDPMLLEGLKTSNPAAYAAFMARMSGNGGFTVRGSSPTK